MSRTPCVFLVLVASACASPEPPTAPVAPVVVAPVAPLPPAESPPAEPLSGNIGPHPFTARVALLVQPNSLTTRCTTENGQRRCQEDIPVSYIRILERPATCAELTGPAERRDIALNPGERMIEVVLQAPWPVAAGSVLRTDETMSNPRRDHVTASFAEGRNGAVAVGSAEFTTNRLRLDLQTTSATLPTSGRIRGAVALVACGR